MTIIWCIIPEIWSETDIVFCHSGPSFALLPRKSVLKKWKNHFEDIIILQMVYHKWQSCDVWFLRYGVQQTAFCVILDRFLPFYPLTTQKIKTLKKWHLYDVWFLRYRAQRTELFVILDHFLPFYVTNDPQYQIFKKIKKTRTDEKRDI